MYDAENVEFKFSRQRRHLKLNNIGFDRSTIHYSEKILPTVAYELSAMIFHSIHKNGHFDISLLHERFFVDK